MQCKRASGCGLTGAVAVVGDFHHASFVIVLTAACDGDGDGVQPQAGYELVFICMCVWVSVSVVGIHIPSHLSP